MRFGRTDQAGPASAAVDPSADFRKRYRRRAWIRYLVVFLIVVMGIGLAAADRSWITASGIVAGQLTAVNPITQARVKKLYAHCLDLVSEGQPIADLENEVTVQAASQQVQQLEIELAQAKADAEVATAEAAAAHKYHDAQVAVHDQLVSVLKAETQLLRDKYVASLVWEKAKADVAKAESEAEAADYVAQTKLEDGKRAEMQAELTQARIKSLKNSPELMGSYQLTAPKSGYLTQCNAFVGTVVSADTTLYQIFNPNDAFAVVFVDPKDAHRLVQGDHLKAQIGGIDGDVDTQVSGFYPELSGLPNTLTRYFWEQEKWSQYEPIRLDFVGLSDADQRALRSSAQVSVSLWRKPSQGIFGRLLASIGG